MIAASKGSSEIMELLLLNKHLDIQVTNESGVNAFWIACFYGHGNIMKLLSSRNIDLMTVNDKGLNVMHLAVIKNHKHIV